MQDPRKDHTDHANKILAKLQSDCGSTSPCRVYWSSQSKC